MKIILRHGPSHFTQARPQISEGELVYFTDTKQLATADASGEIVILAQVYALPDGRLAMQNPDLSYSSLYIKD